MDTPSDETPEGLSPSDGGSKECQDDSNSCPTSPRGSNKRTSTPGTNNTNNPSRRIFTNEFKLNVLEAFNTDPECIGNQRATARKFGIHRRQVQKWLQQPQAKDESSEELSQLSQLVEERIKEAERRPNLRKRPPPKVPPPTPKARKQPKPKPKSPQIRSPTPQTPSPPLGEDLSKLSERDMALSLNLSMNHNHGNNNNNNNPSSSPLLQIPMTLAQFYAQQRESPPFPSNNNKGGGRNNSSPVNHSSSSSGSIPHTTTSSSAYNEHLEIVDEIAYLYPQEDFNLLRQALIRNEVSFTKVNKKVRQSRGQGRGESSSVRSHFTTPPSPSPNKLPPNTNYSAQHALELMRQQSEYVKLLQQSGINLPFGNDLQAFADFQGHKYPPWFPQTSPLLTSAGFVVPNPNSAAYNKKHSSANNHSHTFVSPKPPSNLKPKTVAAALAASRLSPTSSMKYPLGEAVAKSRNSHQRKRQPKGPKPTPNHGIDLADEDFLDPTSMLEVTTTTVEENGVDLSNHGHTNGVNYSSPPQRLSTPSEPCRKSPTDSDSELTKYLALEAFATDPDVAGDARALARKFGLNIRVVMKWIKEGAHKYNLATAINNSRPRENGISASQTSPHLPINGNGNGSGGLKTNGNGNNGYGSLDMSMLKLMTNLSNAEHSNAQLKFRNQEDLRRYVEESEDLTASLQQNANLLQRKNASGFSSGSSANKRKNSKPNQICDFIQEDNNMCFNEGPVDMIVPIKKRRLSSHE